MDNLPKNLTPLSAIQAKDLALILGKQGEGWVSPNPLVGCVLLDSRGRFIGGGYHEQIGQAHAEVNAIANAKKRGLATSLKGATAYVTLEPCSFTGRTGPCTTALLEAGISKVIYGSTDPNPQVNGHKVLQDSGVQVEQDFAWKPKTDQLAEFFLFSQKQNRPFVALKISRDLQHCVGDKSKGRWPITIGELYKAGHRLRQRYDAVLVGMNTERLDRPALTMRGEHHRPRDPIKLVLDREHMQNFVDWLKNLQGARGITSLLVEGGPSTWRYFLDSGCVEKIYLFEANFLAHANEPVLFDDPRLKSLNTTMTEFPEGKLYETYFC